MVLSAASGADIAIRKKRKTGETKRWYLVQDHPVNLVTQSGFEANSCLPKLALTSVPHWFSLAQCRAVILYILTQG